MKAIWVEEGDDRGEVMIVEEKLQSLGFRLLDLEELYRTNTFRARFISYYAVHNVRYLSGTTPLKDGQPFNPGVRGKDLTVRQGYEAARPATLMPDTQGRGIHAGAGRL